MKIKKLAATSAMLIAAMGIAAGTAGAAPTPTQNTPSVNTDLAPHINYKGYNNGKDVVITTDAGTLAVANGQFQIKDNKGTIVGGIPLTLGVDDVAMPIDAKITGNTATLTPRTDKAYYHPVDLPFQNTAPWKTPYDREQAAFSRLKDTISTGSGVGAIVGAVLGGGAGCLVGLTLGVPASVAPVIGTIFGAGAGCIVGALAMAPVGALGGLIFIGAPVAIAAGIQYFTTINAPFKAPAK